MLWMIRWAGPFPIFVQEAKGAHFIDVDGRSYIDFCLGDTGAMTGHSPDATLTAIYAQVKKGITLMLPTADAIWVGEELQRRFGLKYWQFTLTASDANRFAIRMARHITIAKRSLCLITATMDRWMRRLLHWMRKELLVRAVAIWVRL